MIALYYILLALIGVTVGSFLNVLVLRMRTGMTISGRSKCFSCGKILSALELIPLVSFLIQKGRCISCRSKISSQYPLVESGTMVLFMLVGTKALYNVDNLVWLELLFGLVMVSIFVSIFVYDMRHKIIPDQFIIALISLGIINSILKILFENADIVLLAKQIVSGIVLFLPFYLLWKMSKGKWIGLGDGKMALAFGFLFAFPQALSAIVIAFWLGAFYGIIHIIISKGRKTNLKSEQPFAPFLVLGALFVYFFPIDLFHISSLIEIISYAF